MLKEKSSAEERQLRGKIVGDYLKSMRVKAGLTQQDLATKLSYSTAQFISNWERGISLPPQEVLSRLCNLCKIQPGSLVTVLFDYEKEMLKVHKKRLTAFLKKRRH